ncbi:MAG TPA: response regulator [Salinimicrobium catena]|uniref:Response regulator n=1 Tax=Salinimicrobium catena TaxID=390640 RepID=A0A7C2M3E7_9FLAO|nr:response regulator [Salinimicrobium catena]
MKILLAEDDVLTRKSLTYFLQARNYEVILAGDGEIAFDLLKSTSFDLIITDLNMPKIGGLQLIHLIRNELVLDTPVIVLTASGIEQTELDAFAIGASEFISKPFSPSVLDLRIKRLVPQN